MRLEEDFIRFIQRLEEEKQLSSVDNIRLNYLFNDKFFIKFHKFLKQKYEKDLEELK